LDRDDCIGAEILARGGISDVSGDAQERSDEPVLRATPHRLAQRLPGRRELKVNPVGFLVKLARPDLKLVDNLGNDSDLE
jgi:hypothetical protein